MAKGYSYWGKDKILDWRFCIRGKSPKGGMVTLGKFEEEKEATFWYDKLVKEGHYGKLRIEPLQPKPTDLGSIPSRL